jgi:purine-binding chemotaxis protein CheW
VTGVGMLEALLVFRVGQQWFGVDVDLVHEVLPLIELSSIPAAVPSVLGLITVRDVVMPLLDLRVRLGVDAPLRMDNVILSLRLPSGALGLLVDDADRVETVYQDEISLDEADLSAYLSGVVRRADKLIYILNADTITQFRAEWAGKDA